MIITKAQELIDRFAAANRAVAWAEADGDEASEEEAEEADQAEAELLKALTKGEPNTGSQP